MGRHFFLSFSVLLLLAASSLAAPLGGPAPAATTSTTTTSDRRLNRHNLHQRMHKRALGEFERLNTKGKNRAMRLLDRLALRDADSEKLHFEPASGNIYVEDVFELPPQSAEDSREHQHANRRRSISEMQPEKVLSNGLPIFHSKNGSKNVLYLDFDGHSITNSYWGAFQARAFNVEGRSDTFSTSEQADIADIWARVTEDFAAWDIDVTTEEPPKPWTNRVIQALITDTADKNGKALPSASAGGVAYIGVFNEDDAAMARPAFIYYSNLAHRSDFIADCVSHEAGHNLGLSHDGKGSSTYYGGDGVWGPIMGAGYNNQLSQWSRGEYTDATNTEDDVTIISKQLGLRADEAGATAASASPVTFTSATSFRASGIINSRDDVDWWRIDVMGPGSLKVNVEPWRSSVYTEGSDLDVSIKLVSSAGSTVASANPSTSFGATLTVTVSAGTYYLAVDGVGRKGHYSDYASMGQYDISGTVPSGAVPSTTTKAATTATTTKVETTTQTTTTKAATTTTTLQPGEVQYTTGCKCSGAYKARSEAKTVGLDANGLLLFCLHKKNSGGQIAGKVSLIESSGAYSTRFTTPQLSKLHDTLCVMYRPLAGEDEGSTKYRIKRKSTSGGRGKIRWDLK